MTDFKIKSRGAEMKNLWKDDYGRQCAVDSLITHSFDRASAGYEVMSIILPPHVESILTEEEQDQIMDKGFSLLFQ